MVHVILDNIASSFKVINSLQLINSLFEFRLFENHSGILLTALNRPHPKPYFETLGSQLGRKWHQMGQQKDWCSRRSTQVSTSYYLGQSSYLGRNIYI